MFLGAVYATSTAGEIRQPEATNEMHWKKLTYGLLKGRAELFGYIQRFGNVPVDWSSTQSLHSLYYYLNNCYYYRNFNPETFISSIKDFLIDIKRFSFFLTS